MEFLDYRWVLGQLITEWLFCFLIFFSRKDFGCSSDGLEFIAVLLFHTLKCWDYSHFWL